MTETDVVDFLVNLDDELKQTYSIYQDLLYCLKYKNYDLLKRVLNNHNSSVSSYMKTSIKTLIEFLLLKIRLIITIIMVILKVTIILLK